MTIASNQEIELTLAAAPPAMDAIRQSLFNGHPGRLKKLANTYFDTPDRRLRGPGLLRCNQGQHTVGEGSPAHTRHLQDPVVEGGPPLPLTGQ